MKKQLIKELLDLNKLLKKEEKIKTKSKNEIINLEQEMNIIEEKIKSVIKDKNQYEKLTKLPALNKLWERSNKENKEKNFIENNLIDFRKENAKKELKLEKQLIDLKEKETKNDELIEKKIDELANEFERIERHFPDEQKQEQYIISPETMSIHMISRITTEIDFMNTIRKETKNIKTQNEKLLKEIESYLKKLYTLKSKKDSSMAEMSTAAKNSSHLKEKNYIFQQIENNSNNNRNINNISNEIKDTTSSISMEIETNLNLDNLPSDDESLRFIDKVFDIKSNIKPIKNKLKTQFFPPCSFQWKRLKK